MDVDVGVGVRRHVASCDVVRNPSLTIPVIREPSFKTELKIPTTTNRIFKIGGFFKHPVDDEEQEQEQGRRGKKIKDQRGSSNSINLKVNQTYDTMSLRDTATLSPFLSKSPEWLRKKYMERQESQRRKHVLCKDLGGSDCEGWLWKKADGSLKKEKKWTILWCLLDKKTLHYFKHEEDHAPQGTIFLPGFKISPASEIKRKKFAFKTHNPGKVFYFAAESQGDMVKWMNKMGLASLDDLDLGQNLTTAGFLHNDLHDTNSEDASSNCLSDSDADSTCGSLGGRTKADGNISPYSSPRSSIASSREDIADFYKNLCEANVGFVGSNRRENRTTVLLSSFGPTDMNRFCSRLLSLQRTLKDKEQQLELINDFLQLEPIRSSDVTSFRSNNQSLVFELNNTISFVINDEDKENTNK